MTTGATLQGLGKKVINSTLFHSFLAAGLRYDPDNRYVYVPDEQQFGRLRFYSPMGGSWIRAVGLRSFWTVRGRESVRYHLSPTMKVWLDFGGQDVVRLRTRLYLTQLDGTPVKPALMQSRRKVICRSWWNHEWLSRVFATLQLIAPVTGEICIGTSLDEQLILERFPMTLKADQTLHESMLKSREEAREFTDLIERHQSDESEILIDEEETGQTEAPSA